VGATLGVTGRDGIDVSQTVLRLTRWLASGRVSGAVLVLASIRNRQANAHPAAMLAAIRPQRSMHVAALSRGFRRTDARSIASIVALKRGLSVSSTIGNTCWLMAVHVSGSAPRRNVGYSAGR
jgi:hypothetical protein